MRRFLLLLFLLDCSLRQAAAQDSFPEVSVDPRMELLAVVHVLADPEGELDGFSLDGSSYAAQVQDVFSPYRRHPAVGAYLRARRRGLAAVDAQRLMLSLGPPPELELIGIASSHEASLAKALRSFARESRFMDFYEAHLPLYQTWVDEVLAQMPGRSYPAMLQKYSGMKISSRYQFFLVSLRRGPIGNMNHVACLPDGAGYRIFSTAGPSAPGGESPRFVLSERRWDFWHELGHSLLDELLQRHPQSLAATQALFEPIGASCYGSWAQCAREHVAQGLAFRVMAWADEKGETKEGTWSAALKPELPYLEAVIERLKEYERSRNRYPTLEAFYPRLLDVFKELARSKNLRASPRPPDPIPAANSACSRRERPSSRAVDPLLPPEPEPGRPLTAAQLKQRGVFRFSRGAIEDSRADFAAAAALDPADAEAFLNLSVALHRQEKLEESLMNADEAVRLLIAQSLEPEALAAEAFSNRASLQEEMKRRAAARRDWEAALRVAPDDWPRRAETEAKLKSRE